MTTAAMGSNQAMARRDGSVGHEVRMSRRHGCGCPKEMQQSTVTQMAAGVTVWRRCDQEVVSRRNRMTPGQQQQSATWQQAQHAAVHIRQRNKRSIENRRSKSTRHLCSNHSRQPRSNTSTTLCSNISTNPDNAGLSYNDSALEGSIIRRFGGRRHRRNNILQP